MDDVDEGDLDSDCEFNANDMIILEGGDEDKKSSGVVAPVGIAYMDMVFASPP